MPRIMIVDDDLSVQQFLGMVLSSEKFETLLAENASAAMELLQRAPCDLILSDIHLPGMSGVELLEAARSAYPRTQVILFTGAPNIESAAAAVRAGAFDYLLKPVNMQELLRCVRGALKLKAVDDERERLAEANRLHQMELERLVGERTKQLAERNTQLSLAIHAADIGPWDWDLRSGTLYFSPEWKHQIGYSADACPSLYHEWESRLHPDDRKAFLNTLADARSGRAATFEMEYRLRHKDGGNRWFFTRGEVLRDERQEPVRILGCQIDMTARKQAEDQILAFSRRLLAVREEERRKLSAVLHHDAGSLAVSLTARFDAIENELLAGRAEDALHSLAFCQTLFAQSIARLKKIAVDLHPVDLEIMGLSAALRQHADQIANSTKLSITCRDSTKGRRFGGEEELLFFRIAQESLTNAVRHAKAKHIDIRLERVKKAGVRLTVSDDGTGFDPKRATANDGSHLGLRAMKEMSATAGARWQIQTEEGKGTVVSVVLDAAWNKEDKR